MTANEKFTYYYKEYSQDERTWEIESDIQLTEEEVLNIGYNDCNYFEKQWRKLKGLKDKRCSIKYQGTETGDDCQSEVEGDFKQ